MPKTANNLLSANRLWAEKIKKHDPDYFSNLSRSQSPDVLWIGCSDSRVPATQIVNAEPGSIFVHRNIANLVLHSDINCQSVIQYSVQVLRVRHIIVCGHYGCGGVQAALGKDRLGLIDNWLSNIKTIYVGHRDEIDSIEDETDRAKRLVELNVKSQVKHVKENPFVQHEWATHRDLWVHGWVYDLSTGLINDLNITSGQETYIDAYS
ncbi:carbonic anhydrase [Rhodohalobacter mucosus]|uniref:Carbonic anhydrase 2 n=1 Tax=Rhodohalobacter mucosus TaxID=2079485 RepID=A0A316TWF5_9BACT|nr:carbonic anhydrase [Rhodohalobacter mucosus]PWN06884.1 carbonic anhydrase [Rhodohalobacter mucosus]